MKLPLLLLAALSGLTIVSAAAQAVPNGTFDTWVTRNALEVPQGWTTVDEGLKARIGVLYTTVTTSKDAGSNAGAFAAKMETKADPLLSALLGPLPGGVVLGAVDVEALGDITEDQDISRVGGLPFTTRAASMQFYYKLTGPNARTDSAYALVALTRRTGATVQTIATGELLLVPATAYTLGTVPLRYSSSLAPDSIHVAFVSGLAASLTAGTALVVDDVTTTGVVAAARNPALAAALSVYPNPSPTGEFQLASPSNPALATAPYIITDATGHVVRTAAGVSVSQASGRPLELRGLPAGLYVLHLHTPEGPLTRKLLLP